jgi:hypothetical protein
VQLKEVMEELVTFLCDFSISRGLVGVAFLSFSAAAENVLDVVMFRRGKRLLLDLLNFKTHGDSWEGQY